jgi:tRNA A37 N6-isopentenylltransferase MiaA
MHELTPGKVIIVAGGTGLYPFSVLIDLLFKEQLRRTDPSKEGTIYNLSPLLKEKPFEHFTFHLLLAVHQMEDIHPITLMQLLELAKNPSKFRLTLRTAAGL